MSNLSDPIVLSYEDSLIRESDIKLLETNGWINDRIISFWFTYLEKKYDKYDLFCFIYPELVQMLKSKSSRYAAGEMLKDDYFQKKKIWFLPVNDADIKAGGGTHWSLLVVIRSDTNTTRFNYYDSLNGNKSIAIELKEALFEILHEELKLDESIELSEMNCIKQINNYDCGIHLIVNVEAIINLNLPQTTNTFIELSNLEIVRKTRDRIKTIIYQLKEVKNF